MIKILTLLVVCLVIAGSIGIYTYDDTDDDEYDYENYFYGPVPEEYDLDYFRETGETIKEVEK